MDGRVGEWTRARRRLRRWTITALVGVALDVITVIAVLVVWLTR